MPRLSANLCTLVDPSMPDQTVQVQGPQNKDAVPASEFKVYSITLSQHLARDHMPVVEEILSFMQKQYHELQEGQTAKLSVEPFELENQGQLERIVIEIILRKRGDKFYVDYKAGHSIKAHCPVVQASDDEDWHLSYKKTVSGKVEPERTSHRVNRAYPTLLSNSTSAPEEGNHSVEYAFDSAKEKRTPSLGRHASTVPSVMSSGPNRKIDVEASLHERPSKQSEAIEVMDDTGSFRGRSSGDFSDNGRRTSPNMRSQHCGRIGKNGNSVQDDSCNQEIATEIIDDSRSWQRADEMRGSSGGGHHKTNGRRTSASMSGPNGRCIGKHGGCLQEKPCIDEGVTEIIDDTESCQREPNGMRVKSSGERDSDGRRTSSNRSSQHSRCIENDRLSSLEKSCKQGGVTEILGDSGSSQLAGSFQARFSGGDIDTDRRRTSGSTSNQNGRCIGKNGGSLQEIPCIEEGPTEIMDDTGSWQRASELRRRSTGGGRVTDGRLTSINRSGQNSQRIENDRFSSQERPCNEDGATEILGDLGLSQRAGDFQERASDGDRETGGRRTSGNISSQNNRRTTKNGDSLKERPCKQNEITEIMDDAGSWQRASDFRGNSSGDGRVTDGHLTSANRSRGNSHRTENDRVSLQENPCNEDGATEILGDLGSSQRAGDFQGRASCGDRETDGHRISGNMSSQSCPRFGKNGDSLQGRRCKQNTATEIMDDAGSWQRASEFRRKFTGDGRDNDGRLTSANMSNQNGRSIEKNGNSLHEISCYRELATEIMDDSGSWHRVDDVRMRPSHSDRVSDGRRTSSSMNSQGDRHIRMSLESLQEKPCKQDEVTEIIDDSGAWQCANGLRGKSDGGKHDTDGRRTSANMSSEAGRCTGQNRGSLQETPCNEDGLTEIIDNTGSWQRRSELRGRSSGGDRVTDGRLTSVNRSKQNSHRTENERFSLQERPCNEDGATEILGDLGSSQRAGDFHGRASGGDRETDGHRISGNMSSQSCPRFGKNGDSLQERRSKQNEATEIMDDAGSWQRASDFRGNSTGDGRDNNELRTSANMSNQNGRRIGKNGNSLLEIPCSQEIATEIMDDSGSWHRADDMQGKSSGGHRGIDGGRSISGTVGNSGRRTSMQSAPENFQRSSEGSRRVRHECSLRRENCGRGDS